MNRQHRDVNYFLVKGVSANLRAAGDGTNRKDKLFFFGYTKGTGKEPIFPQFIA